jgi:hypothetical protein
MGARSDSAPLSERFNLDAVIYGLASDLDALRAGQISVDDARARSELAKQIMNGVRLVINARKSLEAEARLVSAVKNQAGAE